MTRELVASIASQVGRNLWHGGYGASGNVSVKEGDSLYITRTGVKLGETTPQDVARVDLNVIRSFMNDILARRDSLDFIEKIRKAREIARRYSPVPSSEVFFHAVLPGRVIVHAHHLGVLRAQSRWQELAPSLGGVVARYAPIGVELAEAVLASDPKSPLIFLENHGVVVQGDEADDVLSRFFALDSVERGDFVLPDMESHPLGRVVDASFLPTPLDTVLSSPLLADYVFSCGPEPAPGTSEEELQHFRDRWGIPPAIALEPPSRLVILTHDSWMAQERLEVLVSHALLWEHLPPLPAREVERLVKMIVVFTS